ncbi:MAG: methyltransferase, partial [Moritella sp.]|uniref:methyltransferase n=1 Tax=Moritella sp. TaxID=78556 RepID=UPI0029AC50AF
LNPPFHVGLKTHYASTETFLKEANGYINPRGHLVLVANSFLKYPEIIEAAFGHCLLQIKSSKFAVYYANK